MTEVIAPPEPVTAPAFGLTKFLDPLRIPSAVGPHLWWRQEEIVVHAVRTRVHLHSQLPETEVWAYEGEFPGPTIEVRSGKRLRITWVNEIDGTVPIVGVRGPVARAPGDVPGGYREADGSLLPGFSMIDGLAELPAWTGVHLHGGLTGGGSDGAPHDALPADHAQPADYPNAQRAATLWYHDNAMAVSRFNVHAGLLGMYLVRDAEEDTLDLPHGRHEIPLVLCDRNLDTDPVSGALTGQLLYKTAVDAGGPPIPFSGPFNLVNGVIWPHLDVDRRWYRFRVLNAANARRYRLTLVDSDGIAHEEAVRIIGTDGGLLPGPARIPADGLPLAPGERADLLVDFSHFPGQRLRLTDTLVTGPIEPDLMEFRVDDSARHDPFHVESVRSRSFVRLAEATVPDDHDEVFVALVPPGTSGDPHPRLWELRELKVAPSRPTTGLVRLTGTNGEVRTYQRAASLFDDATTIFVDHGRWVVWNFVNLGGPAHPMHIHLAQLQLLTRRQFPLDANGNVRGFDVTAGHTTMPLPAPSDGRPIDEHEAGWKDTFQVLPGEWVRVAGRFEGATGKFSYRSQILDHEEEGMVRPFVVRPPGVARFHEHG